MGNPLRAAERLSTKTAGGESKIASMAELLAPHRSGQALSKEIDEQAAVEEGFQQTPAVYACVKTIMDAAASVPIQVRERAESMRGTRSEEEFEPATDSPLQRLIDKPNPFMSRQDIIQRVVAHAQLTGNFLIRKVRGSSVNGEVVGELWPLDPMPIKPVPSKAEFIERYEYKEEGVDETFETEDMVHYRMTDPNNPRWGMSPIQAAARSVDTDLRAARWQFNSFDERAIPDGAFLFKGVDQSDFEEARSQIRDQYQGADNARTPMAMAAPEVEWVQMALSPAEMDFIKSRKFTREEIASVYGVPLPMIQVLEDATLANYETARRALWEDTVLVFLEGVRQTFQTELVPEFAEEPGRLKLVWDTSDVDALQQSTEEQVELLVALVDSGVPLNRAIDFLDLPLEPVDGGDVPLVASNRIPLDVLTEGGGASAPDQL